MKGINNNEVSVRTLENLKDSIDNRIHEIYNQGYREGYTDGVNDTMQKMADSILAEMVNDDSVEVVRCRYCKYSRDTGDYQDTYFCDNAHHNSQYLVHSREYCSHGKRRE